MSFHRVTILALCVVVCALTALSVVKFRLFKLTKLKFKRQNPECATRPKLLPYVMNRPINGETNDKKLSKNINSRE